MSDNTPFTLVGELADLRAFGITSPNEEDCRNRYNAFIAPLDAKQREAVRFAMDFFAWFCDLNSACGIVNHLPENSPKRESACEEVAYFAHKALGSLKRFGAELGCGDLTQTGEKLDGLVKHARSMGWAIAPDWWLKYPEKSTAHFIDQLKIHAENHKSILRSRADEAEQIRLLKELKAKKRMEDQMAKMREALANAKGGAE